MKEFIHYFFSVMDKTDLKKFKKYIAVVFVASIFSVLGIGAIIPFIHVLIQPEKISHMWMFNGWQYKNIVLCLTLILILAYLIKNVAAFALLSYQSNFLYGLVGKIQKKLFSGYISLPYEYHLNRNTADLIKNVNVETTTLGAYVVAPLGTLLSELSSVVFVLLALFIINPIFTMFVTIFLGSGIFLFMKLIRFKLTYYSMLRTKSLSFITNQVLSSLSGIKEVKLYNRENFFLRDFKNNSDDLKNASVYQYTYQNAARMVIEFIGLAVVMSVLCGFVLIGSKPEELFVLLGVFGIAAAQLLPSLNRLTQSIVQIKYGMPALKIIYQEMETFKVYSQKKLLNTTSHKPIEFTQLIKVSELSYSYQDGTVALKNINLNIIKGKRIALVGASGAGKTTFVDLLMGLYSPQSGIIITDDKIINDVNLSEYQKLFSYIPQSIILYDQTIKQNIAFGVEVKNIDIKQVRRCLKASQLDNFVEQLADKENSFIGEGGLRLSGGQRQRLGIARALYRQSQILVMDEATSALDYKTEYDITHLFSELKDLTIITIAHRLTTIQNYDVIYVFDKGRVVSSGTFNDLQNKCKWFQQMLQSVKKNDVKDPQVSLDAELV